MKNLFGELTQKEMNRKEFLQYIGIASLLVFGAGSILRAFGGGQVGKNSTEGYGSNTYGLRSK